MLKGFRDFLLRGNVIDLAVAVVIGTAFTAVVTAIVTGIVNPLLDMFGGANEHGWGFYLDSSKPSTFIAIGPIITAVVNFILIAAILYFILILPAGRLMKRFGTEKEAVMTEVELLTDIRDLLADGSKSAGGRHEFSDVESLRRQADAQRGR
ncbi:large conductance mechanosensitive channel protein MscL [Nocardia africana]|uniref:Large-conductance mechanosensitive channel n=1 Tax=Nocardia africana TaxID=134964 RepID=A0A378X4F0_9NOCA|nr:large conductance mechanosensitive channel protein MscL [Nocardia africana]MCC3317298.1 large conductance mechanosensitive channel protein MscL [Nocardia africana]SUA48032.1 Large-conductance mechanosensitive channel [Nocardia africana]